MNASEDPSPAIRRAVQEFAQAWYWGDSEGMLGTLHPDYVNRLVTLGTQSRPLGVQGSLGSQTPPDLRTVEVRILEVRKASASAVAELCGWVIHLHLAKSAGPWKIVNAMWESRTA
ncbi:nuclear transport factor 2 family protein [Mesoterricola silvestris]|uniref:nuclear transport factor 2 family protein n=1 Tax=Mesoterricola silvestris TaxID=2927979 RepID=UPI002930DEA0|nr:nuclear transport factor 2 family protein [Mesoterricola silvestris]